MVGCDVQGFKKEEVRIRADNQGHVIVSGERQANDTKILHFEQSYIVPEGCNIQGTSAILEDDTYYVIIPKKMASNSNSNSISTLTSVQAGDQVQDKMPDGADNANNSPQGITKTDDEEDPHRASSGDDSFLEKLSKKLKRKRCLVLTALLAFSLGVVVSHRYNSTPQVLTSQ